MIIGLDPSRAPAALADLRSTLPPGAEWRVLTLHQNPNGADPVRPTPSAEHHGLAASLFHRLAGLLGRAQPPKTSQEGGPRRPLPVVPEGLELSEAELNALRHSPNRAATAVLVVTPEATAQSVRQWSVRHGGFDLSPAPAKDEPGASGAPGAPASGRSAA
jgi:hypothetical protein